MRRGCSRPTRRPWLGKPALLSAFATRGPLAFSIDSRWRCGWATSTPRRIPRSWAAPPRRPLFFAIADSLPRTGRQRQRPAPSPSLNLRRVAVCAPTGDLPGPHCPAHHIVVVSFPGVSPIKVSTVHRAVRVDAATGFRACRPGAEGVREEVFEFWPSDMEAVFRRAGVAVRRPPPWAADCGIESLAASGQAPRIRSPEPALTYHAVAAANPRQQGDILFSATTDADAEHLFWFVDNQLVAKVARGQPHFWTPATRTFHGAGSGRFGTGGRPWRSRFRRSIGVR